MNQIADRLVTLAEVTKTTAKAKSSLYLEIKRGAFPAPRKSGRRLVWLASEIEAWMAALPRVQYPQQGGRA